jgi:TolA-binding protein
MLETAAKTVITLAISATVALVSTGPVCAQGDTQESVSRQLETLTRTVEELSQQVRSLQQKLDQMENRGQASGETRKSKNAPVSSPAPAAATTTSTREQAQQEQQARPAPPVSPASPSPPPAPVAMPAEHGANPAGPPTAAEAWASIKEGMTEGQVVVLLGEPTRKFKAGGQTVWYYLYRDKGAGSVFFYDDGRVASRQKPPFARWHW